MEEIISDINHELNEMNASNDLRELTLKNINSKTEEELLVILDEVITIRADVECMEDQFENDIE